MNQTNKVKTTSSKILVIVFTTFHDFFSEDQKIKKVFTSKITSNSGFRLKILAIFYEFLGEDQKKKGLRPKSFIKSGVSPQKLRKFGQ